MFKADYSRKSMVEKALQRLMTSRLEMSRAQRAYKQYLKETKSPKQLEGDNHFDRLRNEMEITKSNNAIAQLALDAINKVPPMERNVV